ncbi:MAG: (2Fe-2S) ferredoxin domain-containing protein [Bacteroidia bacterium]
MALFPTFVAMEDNIKYHRHVFICTNQRASDAPRPSCGEQTGMALVAAFKKAIKDKKLDIRVRAQRAGCLDLCEHGPTVVVYPEAVFYGNVSLADVEEIVDQHIVSGNPVQRLRLKFDKAGEIV